MIEEHHVTDSQSGTVVIQEEATPPLTIQSLGAPRPKLEDRQKWRSGFHWATVERDLAIALILAVGREDDRPEPLEALDDAQLAAAASLALGTLPSARAMDRLTPVLKEHWLPNASHETIAELTPDVQAGLAAKFRGLKLRDHRERVRFLQERKVAKNFKVRIRKAFMDAHKAAWIDEFDEYDQLEITSRYDLRGHAMPPAYEPFAHSQETWRLLDALHTNGEPIRGLIVIPTGGGKTDIAVDWVLRRLAEDPDLGVLWIAHQIALLEQAAETFHKRAALQPTGFERTLRIFCSGGQKPTLLHPQKTDVALATIQSLSRGITKRSKRRKEVTAYLQRPTIVIVDEAHHAAARGYQALLGLADRKGAVESLLGLTAPPWPSTEYAEELLDQTFPTKIIERDREELIASGVLASYDEIVVRTGEQPDITELEWKATQARGDFVPSVLRKLETDERNGMVVHSYLQDPARWGRTLLFTTTIANANRLLKAFRSKGVDAQALHTGSAQTLRKLRPWFEANERAVLISVGMLLEGVDLPKARTALIARPTMSPVIYSQMIGRVLRGPAAGGESSAHVVYFQDDFGEQGPPRTGEPPSSDGGPPPRAGARFPVDLPAVSEDVLQPPVSTGGGEDPFEIHMALIEERRLVGYYEVLDGLAVPVFEHQLEALESFLEAPDPEVTPGDVFAECPYPWLPQHHLAALADATALSNAPPPLVRIATEHAPIRVAERLADGSTRTEAQRRAIIEEIWSEPLVRAVFATANHLAQAVTRAQMRRSSVDGTVPTVPKAVAHSLKPLPRAERKLEPLVRRVLADAARLLPANRLKLLELPEVMWTTKVTRSFFADITPGREPGQNIIRVNRLLRTTKEHVSDELLCFLLWHEVVHAVTPGQPHDAEFYELEMRWPGAIDLDAELDSLGERWATDPADYRSISK
jgi:superfamily II DNA or RNA helicase